ncbi:sensor histidine kinase [Mucilaginibacter sp. BJC16-A38]|uniref:tetratricopeptide repeat-containing sensor histidine kinase n=1 Tax=Mucilaginibacter phenanthrenivorans TaxID=1234842 RepID=UPI002157AB76|nr:sensor histidine kinase [Mucilaginibacter phenanthrenivorans]MCR8557300.1 sensor histidine kinase [Mucilaginibacter phenanthrenivorans]
MKKLSTSFLTLFITVTAFAQLKNQDREQLLKKLKNIGQDTPRLAVLIALSASYDDLPAEGKTDSAEIYLDQAKKLNEQFRNVHYQNSINLVGAKIQYSKKPDLNLEKLFLPLISDCLRTGDSQGQLAALLALIERMTDKPRPDPSYQSFLWQATRLSRQLHDRKAQLTLLKYMAEVHIKEHKLDSAEKELIQISSDPATSNEDLLNCYDRLAGLYTTKGKYEKALKYAFKTQHAIRSSLDTANILATSYGRLRLIYSLLGNPSESNIWAKKAFDYCLKKGQYDGLALIRGSIASNLIAERKPQEALRFVLDHEYKRQLASPNALMLFQRQVGDCYYALREYPLAEKSYQQLLLLMNSHSHDLSVYDGAVYNFVIGKFYVNTGREAFARTYLLNALAGYKATAFVSFIKDTYLLLFKVDSAAGHYSSAIKYLQESNRLKDSIFSSEKSKQIEELQIAYQTEQKNKNIQQLQNNSKYQQLKLLHADSTRNWITAGLSLVLIIAGLLYRQARSARRTNKATARKNEILQQLVHEKEWLLKEVHHRVKNNLHTVISLLESQAKYLKDEALKAIETSQHRIFAMSLLHQKLYRSDKIKMIEMAEYISELMLNLEKSFGVAGEIDFEIKVDALTLDIAYAIPLGLIINEAVTNAIKYAFPKNGKGKIGIVLYQSDENIHLEMTDNGIGIPKCLYVNESGTLGIELMKGLCGDINGQIMFDASNGTRIHVSFAPTATSYF